MTIDFEEDTDSFFLIAKKTNGVDYREALSEYLKKMFQTSFSMHFFLCDSSWQEMNRIVTYRKLWKQGFINEIFHAYVNNIEYELRHSNQSKIMYASIFKCEFDDFKSFSPLAATNSYGTSFFYLRKINSPHEDCSVKTICDLADFELNKCPSLNWDSIISYMQSNDCYPMQRWEDANIFSLRVFLPASAFPR